MATAKRNVHEMETYTGRYVDLLDPKPEQICLADIAVGLANAPRFGGQISRWYSVAEHSVRVHDDFVSRSMRLAALFHDAHEAYTGDIVAPLKWVLGDSIRDVQHLLDVAIAAHFRIDLNLFKHPQIKAADDAVMFREAAGLKYSHGVGEHWGNETHHEPLVAYGWSPAEAEQRFIDTYRRLQDA